MNPDSRHDVTQGLAWGWLNDANASLFPNCVLDVPQDFVDVIADAGREVGRVVACNTRRELPGGPRRIPCGCADAAADQLGGAGA